MNRTRGSRCHRWRQPFAALIVGCFLTAPAGRAKTPWATVSPEELHATKSTLEPDAPAEIVDLHIDVDDLNLPEERVVDQYWRYKIFDAAAAAKLMHLSERNEEYDGDKLRRVDMEARVHLPDGSVHDYGREAIRDRDISKQGSVDSVWRRIFVGRGFVVTERLLDLGHVPAGSVVELHTRVRERPTWGATFRQLQFESLPVRHVLFTQRSWDRDDLAIHLLYRLNSALVKVTSDSKHHRITAEGNDLPSLRNEPFAQPVADRAAILFDCYIGATYRAHKPRKSPETKGFPPNQPWAPVASLENWKEQDHVEVTDAVKAKATELAQGATSDLEKAKRVHDFIVGLHQQFIRAALDKELPFPGSSGVVAMEKVLTMAPRHPGWLGYEDFIWLEISLDQALGLRAEDLMLPDRGLVHFSPNLPAPALLPIRAVAVQVGGNWHFSYPVEATPLPFDELPWQAEGYSGLLALDGKQEMIQIPLATAEQNLVRYAGDFRMDGEGTLVGDFTVTYRGHAALAEREKIFGQARAEQLADLQKPLAGMFDGAEVQVTDVRNVDDPNLPLEVRAHLNWSGFGVLADQRLIFHPFVFRTTERSPFSAKRRTDRISFPFRREVLDELTIALPTGFRPEVKEAPPSFPGPVLSYKVDLALDQKHRVLHVNRDLVAGAILVDPKDYEAVKTWYDRVAVSDQHDLVLIRDAEPAPAKTGNPP